MRNIHSNAEKLTFLRFIWTILCLFYLQNGRHRIWFHNCITAPPPAFTNRLICCHESQVPSTTVAFDVAYYVHLPINFPLGFKEQHTHPQNSRFTVGSIRFSAGWGDELNPKRTNVSKCLPHILVSYITRSSVHEDHRNCLFKSSL